MRRSSRSSAILTGILPLGDVRAILDTRIGDGILIDATNTVLLELLIEFPKKLIHDA